MITAPRTPLDPTPPDRMVVVTAGLDEQDLLVSLKSRYPDLRIAACDTYLAAIAEVARRPARAVLACVGSSTGQLDSAVAGLREAAGEDTKVVLCCTPESEPKAQRAIHAGADDYVIYPPDGPDLDGALGYVKLDAPSVPALAPAPPVTENELIQLGSIIAAVDGRPMEIIEKLAELVRCAMRSKGATVVVEGAVATSGDVVTKPVLSAPIEGTAGVMGQLTLAEPMGDAYTLADARKLTHYATIASYLISTARTQRQWHELAMTDECTGLPNRRYLYRRLDAILAEAAEKKLFATVLVFDLDEFKSFNDQFGHDAGDEIIRVTGQLFRQHCREQDIVCRYGGDEFVVVFWDPEGPRVPGSRHPECALAVVERFKKALSEQTFSKLDPTAQGTLTISGGLATYPWDGVTRDALLKQADEALLAAKRAGKNRVLIIGRDDAQTSSEPST